MSLFYIKTTMNYKRNNKLYSSILTFEAVSKLSAATKTIASLHQLGFDNITVDECHRATPSEINAYMSCRRTPNLH